MLASSFYRQSVLTACGMSVPNHVNTLKCVRGSELLAASSLQSSHLGWPGSIAGFKIESVVTEADVRQQSIVHAICGFGLGTCIIEDHHPSESCGVHVFFVQINVAVLLWRGYGPHLGRLSIA